MGIKLWLVERKSIFALPYFYVLIHVSTFCVKPCLYGIKSFYSWHIGNLHFYPSSMRCKWFESIFIRAQFLIYYLINNEPTVSHLYYSRQVDNQDLFCHQSCLEHMASQKFVPDQNPPEVRGGGQGSRRRGLSAGDAPQVYTSVKRAHSVRLYGQSLTKIHCVGPYLPPTSSLP